MDRNSLWGLVRALRAAGHEVYFPRRPLDGYEAAHLCLDLGIDVFFALNRARAPDLPARVRHIAWFQDPPRIPADIANRVQTSDIVYWITTQKPGEPGVDGKCKTGYLFLAIDEKLLDSFVPPGAQTLDFSYCGTMVPPFYVPPVAAPVAVPTPPRNIAGRPRWKQNILDAHSWFVGSRFAQTLPGQAALGLLRKSTGGRLGWMPAPQPHQRSANWTRPQVIDSEIIVAIMNA